MLERGELRAYLVQSEEVRNEMVNEGEKVSGGEEDIHMRNCDRSCGGSQILRSGGARVRVADTRRVGAGRLESRGFQDSEMSRWVAPFFDEVFWRCNF